MSVTLNSLIKEQRERIPSLQNVGYMTLCYEYPNMEEYYNWLATAKRYIGINYPNDKDIAEFERVSNIDISPDQQRMLLAILEAFAVLPTIIPNNKTSLEKNVKRKDAINVTTTINNTNSQSQNQEQSLAIDLFINAIKDDLTGRQIKELKAVVEETDNDLQKARSGILAKLKEFGTDVASNIVANILTNPIIWGGL